MMTYEAWRISYQSSEQAARAAYAALEQRDAEIARLRALLDAGDEPHPLECPACGDDVNKCGCMNELYVRRANDRMAAWPDPGSQVVS